MDKEKAIAKCQKAIEDLSALKSACLNVREDFSENDSIANNVAYPFKKDFDEITEEVTDWANKLNDAYSIVIEYLKNID